MPTVLRIGRFRLLFYSNEGQEPAHIHVVAGGDEAKFWLDPVRLAFSHGFSSSEVRRLELLVDENRMALLEAWDDYFRN
jgi:hypothetical protein